MGLRNSRGRWQYRFRVQGQDVSVSTGLEATARNRKKAEQMEAAHRQAILEGRWGFKPLIPRAFSEAVTEFLQWCKVEYASKPNTWGRIKTSMASCGVWFGKSIVSLIQPGDVERYKVWRATGDDRIAAVKPVTVKHDLDNLSVFFRWAIKQNYARVNPTKEVKRPSDADAQRQKVLTDAEEKLYFAHAGGNLAKVARLILLQGMRPEEVMSLRKPDVNLTAGTLRIQQGKTKAAARTLRLTTESAAILEGQMMTDGPWVFPSEKRPGKHIAKLNCPHGRVLKKTGLRFVLYDLRHTFATRMAAAGVDAFALAAILGHSTTRVLTRYVHPTQAHQDEAMANHDRRNEERRKQGRVM